MKKSILLLMAIMVAVVSCKEESEMKPAPMVYPDVAEASNPAILADVNGVKVYNGGFGSAMVQDSKDSAVFYLLTDRGPNIDGTVLNQKVFAKPDFAPQIGKFRLKDKTLVLESTIELKNEAGVKLTGLPNPAGQGATGETAITPTGTSLATSIDGLDPEGLVVAPDGTFWVSDEYGPHLVHFDATGKTIERLNPFSTSARKLPLVLARRRANRGMEGLAITPDGRTLVGMMQFPLYNPSATAISGSLAIRILTFDIASGATKQYVYLMERANLQAVSEITAITNTTFLVIERDGEFATEANKATVVKKVYKIDLANATDISDPANSAGGKLFGGKTVEELKTLSTLAANGITPVTKTLVADLMTDIPTLYPHDKAEGVVVINRNMIAVCNDDDFGVVGAGTYTAKNLAGANNTVDKNKIYFIKLKQPL
jgi:Esterase-like activity of phytase